MSAASLPALVVRRWYRAPRELAFRAFTQADLMEKWFCPDPSVALIVDRLDAKEGGTYRFLFHFPDGRIVPLIGTYQVLDPPSRIVKTWTWEPPDPDAGIETQVTITFEEKDGGVEVTVTHERFPSQERYRQHESGWAGALDNLGRILPAA